VVHRGRETGLVVWEHDKELIAPDGSKREVDASFVVGQRLYIVECKASRSIRASTAGSTRRS
jgi:hypothetical protein